MSDVLQLKLQKLKDYFASLGSVAIAFSSGVDSTFMLKVAKDVLHENVIAVTVVSETFTKKEESDAIKFCRDNGIIHEICQINQFDIDGFCNNPPNRCYLCKKVIFENIRNTAEKYGVFNIAEGSNMDDLGDYRPGLKAIEELGVLSPLRAAGLYKTEIRQLSKQLGLNTYNKPSYACLASRVAYGEKITHEKLRMIEHAEEYLHSLGFLQSRVRVHEIQSCDKILARVEVGEMDFSRLVQEDIRRSIAAELKKTGFAYVTMDLEGYRMGSMNELL